MPIAKNRISNIGVHDDLLMQFHKLIGEMISRSADQYEIIWGSFLRLIGEINDAIIQARRPKDENYIKEQRIAKAVQYIKMSYNLQLKVRDIADVAGYSVSWFENLFREQYHMSPIQYQMKQRVDKAMEMIRSDLLNISEISYAIGFHDPFYFSRVFKKFTGVSPSHYRDRALSEKSYDR